MTPLQYKRIRSLSFSLGLAIAVSGCTSLIQKSQQLSREGRYDEAISLLQERLEKAPTDQSVRIALENTKEDSLNFWSSKAERELQAGRTDAARELIEQAAALNVQPRRVTQMRERLELLVARDDRMAQAQQAYVKGYFEQATNAISAVLAQTPMHAPARQLKRQLRERAQTKHLNSTLPSSFPGD